MNEVLTTIKERRSIRRFKSEQISNKELNYILEAGLYAPSAHNQQSWHFTVVQSKKVIDELNSGTKKAFANAEDEKIRALSTNEKFHIFYDAPTVIIISGDENCMMPQADCGAATQNMLLAAESLNIGGCWNGYIAFLFNDELGKSYIESLDLPDGQKPYYAIALGYKGVDKLKAPPRKENRIHYIRD
jgi:nitroreductase